MVSPARGRRDRPRLRALAVLAAAWLALLPTLAPVPAGSRGTNAEATADQAVLNAVPGGTLAAPGDGTKTAQAVAAAGDPVIAAAGDIACEPSKSGFNGGYGSSSSCRQK